MRSPSPRTPRRLTGCGCQGDQDRHYPHRQTEVGGSGYCWGALLLFPPLPPPEGTLGYCTWAQEAISTKSAERNFGSSVAYKTIGAFPSQE